MTPDINEAQRFLNLLDPGGVFTFQTFDDHKPKPGETYQKKTSLIRVLHGTFDHHAATLGRLNEAGAGVFVMVNEGDGIVHSGENTCRAAPSVVRVRAYFVDLDGAPLDPVLATPLPPSIVVESSPGRYHAYWPTDGCPLEEFQSRQKMFISKFNGDQMVCDLPRVMRLPGFVHRKSEAYFRSRIISPVSE